MKPYPFTPNRTFDLDRYLDQQLDRSRAAEAERMMQNRYPNGKDFTPLGRPTQFPGLQVEPQFRGWAVRLNAWCERQLDRLDWVRIDIWLGTIGGFVITGVALYFLYILLDAWLQGRLNLGAN